MTGRWYRFTGVVLVGVAAFVVALVTAGVQAEVALVCAGLTLLAAGGPLLLWRDRRAAVVGVCVSAAFGAGLAVLHHLAEDAARQHLAEHPPEATTTTAQTFVVLPAGASCDAYPYSTYDACEDQP